MARPFVKRVVGSQFVRVEAGDWVDVKRGRRRVFRTPYVQQGTNVPWPMPAVAWRWTQQYGHDSMLIVVESLELGLLGDVGDGLLGELGFESFADYRRDWVIRHKKRFPPEKRVMTVRFRPWVPTDRELFGDKMLTYLYRDWV